MSLNRKPNFTVCHTHTRTKFSVPVALESLTRRNWTEWQGVNISADDQGIGARCASPIVAGTGSRMMRYRVCLQRVQDILVWLDQWIGLV